jgi:hypothetical protein
MACARARALNPRQMQSRHALSERIARIDSVESQTCKHKETDPLPGFVH